MLEGLAALLEAREMEIVAEVEVRDKTYATGKPDSKNPNLGPRGPNPSRPPVQIHVHEDAATGRMTVQTDAGERELDRADSERMRCDAAVCEHGGRNTTTILPRVRRTVLARDKNTVAKPRVVGERDSWKCTTSFRDNKGEEIMRKT